MQSVAHAHPQIFPALHDLEGRYKLRHHSTLITATFGHFQHSLNGSRFCNELSRDVWSALLGVLTSCSEWTTTKDWTLERRFQNRNVTWTTETNKETGTLFGTRRRQASQFFYGYPAEENNPSPGEPLAELRHSVVCVNLFDETEERDISDSFSFHLVEIMAKKVFVWSCKSLPGFDFCFELSQVWSGNTLTEANRALFTTLTTASSFFCSSPGYRFECVIVDRREDKKELSSTEVTTLLCSMLLKMQDFLDFSFRKRVPDQIKVLPMLIPLRIPG